MLKEKSRMDAIYERDPESAWNIIEGQAVVLDPREGQLCRLNPAASSLWQRLDGEKTLAAVLQELENEYAVNLDILRKDVLNLVERLHEMELIRSVGEKS